MKENSRTLNVLSRQTDGRGTSVARGNVRGEYIQRNVLHPTTNGAYDSLSIIHVY